MKILELTKSLHRGGVEKHILDLSICLKSKGHDVIVGADNLLEKDEYKKNGIKVIHIPFMDKNPIHVIDAIKKLHAVIINEEIDIIHCHWRICCAFIKLHNLIYEEKIRYVWTCHSSGIDSSFLIRKISFFDEYIIGCSSDCSNLIIKKYRITPERVYTIFNGVEIIDNPEDRHIKSENYRITVLGRLDPIKNHKCMLRALKILTSEYKITNIITNITGNGNDLYKRELEDYSISLGVDKFVDFCGYVNPYDILANTDVMVLPSEREGFPVSVLEAFNMKIPVIRTRTGGYFDVKDYCWSIDFDSEKQLADTIYKMYSGDIDTTKKVNSAHDFLEAECSLEVMTDKILDVYHKYNY